MLRVIKERKIVQAGEYMKDCVGIQALCVRREISERMTCKQISFCLCM